jgi:hypothetical protein
MREIPSTRRSRKRVQKKSEIEHRDTEATESTEHRIEFIERASAGLVPKMPSREHLDQIKFFSVPSVLSASLWFLQAGRERFCGVTPQI